ncbi:hypothetical protein HZH66_015472 [Vespula vulgaris]|uniref:Uncharacterized protein n=1 Tax=Vespula vulgaris TaxID=7454 RepID=A0A834IY43_VESVU|nr:hypothetical protein HZH66_015472 [Vespula vulgaris]
MVRNGQVERQHRTIINYLTQDRNNWDRWIPLCLRIYRSGKHKKTGLSPAEMLIARNLIISLDLLQGCPSDMEILFLIVNTRSAIRWDRLVVLYSPFHVYDTVIYNKKAPRRRISFWKESQEMGPTLIYENLASVGTKNFGIQGILQESEDFSYQDDNYRDGGYIREPR